MSKIIDADALKSILETKSEILRTGCPDNLYGVFLQKVTQMIDLMPAADAEPVVHAHWNLNERTPYGSVYYCSKCGDRLDSRLKGPKLIKEYPYCHCGAKMEEE